MTSSWDRRRFLASVAGTVTWPTHGWAAAGAPRFLAATQDPDGRYRLVGLGADGDLRFQIDLPSRGHAAAAHPNRPEAVAFARRPGVFALVVDCAEGRALSTLEAPPGRHFYGHGAFSADGALLFTTENAFETGQGRLGVWDATCGYARVGEVASGGIGPHDVRLMPDGRALAIANGGIRTHPRSGREKLNLATMRPNLTYVRPDDGAVLEAIEPPRQLRLNSIRHLAVGSDATVAVALQWQGDPADGMPLLAFHRRGDAAFQWAESPAHLLAAMSGYAGSVAFDGGGTRAAITSPRGGRVMAWDVVGGNPDAWVRPDVCGIVADDTGWIATDGHGGVISLDRRLAATKAIRHESAFDNHLVSLHKYS
ncbi:MAG: DUF1513 domain-containing protein [Pseudomonadota bacterium]